MKTHFGWLPILAAITINFQWVFGLPVPEDQITINGGKIPVNVTVDIQQRRAYIPHNQPPSPIHFFGPDKIYYYTHDNKGGMVVKEMTEKEIQSLIAAGGGNLPVPVQEPPKVEGIQPGGTKVSDVVKNVKKVVVSELSKPAPAITAIPTIPGHANSEWSNILPSILSGEPDPGTSSQPTYSQEPEIRPNINIKPDVYPTLQGSKEKPMIPVPMITVDKPSHHEKEENGKPVYEILNTISAEKAGATSVNHAAVYQDQAVGASEAVKPVRITSSTTSTSKPEYFNIDKNYKNHTDIHTTATPQDASSNDQKKDTVSVIAESSSTSVKISGQDEVKIHHEELFKPHQVFSTTKSSYDLSKTQPEHEEIKLIIASTASGVDDNPQLTENPLSDKSEYVISLKPTTTDDSKQKPTFEITFASNTEKIESSNKISSSTEASSDKDGGFTIIDNSAISINILPTSTESANMDINDSTTLSAIETDTATDTAAYSINLAYNSEKADQKADSATLKPNIQSLEDKEKIESNEETSTIASNLESPSKSESMLPDLTDSISSMINQVSDALPVVLSPTEEQKSKVPVSESAEGASGNSHLESKDSGESNEFKVEELSTTEATMSTLFNEISETKIPGPEDAKSGEIINPDVIHFTVPLPTPTIPSLEEIKDEDKNSEISSTTITSNNATESVYNKLEWYTTEANIAEITTLSSENPKSEEKNPLTDKLEEISIPDIEYIKLEEKRPQSSNKVTEIAAINNITNVEDTKIEEKISEIDLSIQAANETSSADFVSFASPEKPAEINITSIESLPVPIIGVNAPQFFEIKTSEAKPENNKLELSDTKESNIENEQKNQTAENVTESPIVRINVTEPKEDQPLKTKPEIAEETQNITESPMVRIKLTNPMSAVHAIMESSPVQERTPEYETLSLPSMENLPANGVGSGLIAGYQDDLNSEQKTSFKTEIPMQTIQFDQLPMVHNSVELAHTALPSSTEKISTFIGSSSVSTDKKESLEAENRESVTIIPIQPAENTSLNSSSLSEAPNAGENVTLPIILTENSVESIETTLSSRTDADASSSTSKITESENLGTKTSTELPISLTTSKLLPTTESSTAEIQTRPKDQKKETSMEALEKISTLSPPKPSKKQEVTERPTLISTKPEVTNWVQVPQPEDKVGNHPLAPEEASQPSVALDHSKTTPGLDSSVQNLEPDISYFSNLCNDLAFSLWNAINPGLSTSRSIVVSPFGITSMLAMIFLGARGSTSNQMNDVLKLDDVSSFNPHLVFQNISDSVSLSRHQGVANAVFVRELFADKLKVRKLLPFYKEQAQQFYDGIVAEVNFAYVSDVIRRRTNLMIRKQTGGRIRDFVKSNPLPLRSPLAALSANVFQTDCSSIDATSEGRDGELYFAVSPAVRQRKLIPVPATLWKAGVLAGYEPSLDATAISLGGLDKLISTIFVVPGQPGATAPGDNLSKLEQRMVDGALHDGAWNKLLKVIIPRPGLELQVPKFSHRSIINATSALKSLRLYELFDRHADLKGINGIGHDLHLADVFQMNLFSTCGDENVLSGKHHEEVYPAGPQRNARSENDDIHEDQEDQEEYEKADNSNDEENDREAKFSRQVDEKPRLKLDRPFLYFVRHNPTGLILHMGRFNPRLLP